MRSSALPPLLLLAACVAPNAGDPPAAAPAASAPAAAPAPTVPAGNPAVGGVVMPTGQPIADTLAAAPTLSQLVRAAAAGGVTETLRAPGPYTVFAPTDEAWGRLQPGTVEALLKPENRAALAKLLGLHIVSGRYGALDLMALVAAGNGRATLTTIAGEPISVTVVSGIVTLTDAGGNRSYVETADVRASNGVIHVVNGVLVPRLN